MEQKALRWFGLRLFGPHSVLCLSDVYLLCLYFPFAIIQIFLSWLRLGPLLSPVTLLIPIPDLSSRCLFTSLLLFTIPFSPLLSCSLLLLLSSSPLPFSFLQSYPLPSSFLLSSTPLFSMDTISCCSSAACQWRLRLWNWIVLDSFPGQIFWLKPGQAWNGRQPIESP